MSGVKRLAVLLYGAKIGETFETRAGRPAFTYAEEWMKGGPGVPLSLSIPLSVADHDHKTVAPYLWGLLPDSQDRLEAIARAAEEKVSAGNPISLLGEIGEDCAGAVQFVRPDRVGDLEGECDVELLGEADIAMMLRRCREGLPPVRSGDRGKYSVAGMQPKVALHRQVIDGTERWGVPHGRTPTTHILKPPIPDLSGQLENEHFCLKLASALGLAAANSAVMSFSGENAIVVERYDRLRRPDGRYARVHQEDMCQALAIMPANKYQSDGGPSPERIVGDVLRASMAPREAVEADVRTFLSAVALNWVIAGTDAHGKNFSIVHGPRGAFRLAPMYDIISALPYDPIRDIKMSLRVAGDYGFDVYPRHWAKLARGCRFDPAEMNAIVDSLVRRCPDIASDVAAKCREDGLTHPVVESLTDLIAGRCREIAARYSRADLPLTNGA